MEFRPVIKDKVLILKPFSCFLRYDLPGGRRYYHGKAEAWLPILEGKEADAGIEELHRGNERQAPGEGRSKNSNNKDPEI
jgi:hypothetical protein